MNRNIIDRHIEEHFNALETIDDIQKSKIDTISKIMISSLKNKGTIYWCGNGGSSSDSQHLAAELVGRYKTQRKGLPAIALTTDSSSITAISNDFGYTKVFDRQIEALANKGDVVIGISTSGKSANVISALKLANDLGCITIGLSGNDGGELDTLCNVNLIAQSNDTPRIQEMHILIGHIICHLIDLKFNSSS